MKSFALYDENGAGIAPETWQDALRNAIDPAPLRRVLILPPDYTRLHSMAGEITDFLYRWLSRTAQVDVMPALGTHAPMTQAECAQMFPNVPFDKIIVHDWRRDVVRLGEVPSGFVREASEGAMSEAIPVEINRRLLDPAYDLILSPGQVVPHEVVGMANRNKNLCVGCGGSGMINASHMLGAAYGMERVMGRDKTPVRRVFDYAEEHFFAHIPLAYLLTVTTAPGGAPRMHGLFAGRERSRFEQAVSLARQKNMTLLDAPLQTVVVNLDEREFKTTWLGNKAVYRTRMAIADGGRLYVLAPGVKRFGEDFAIDALIRKYGYCGRENILRLARENDDLAQNLSAAAHLIHASADGRFTITYCTRRLTEAEVRGACFDYLPYDEAVARFRPETLRDGMNENGVFYVSNPALGLWALKSNFEE